MVILTISFCSSSSSFENLRALVLSIRGKRKPVSEEKGSDSPFNEIEFGKPLKKIPKSYHDLVFGFDNYLYETSNSFFHVKGTKLSSSEVTGHSFPYIHRWTEIYKKSVIAKLYKLERALGELPQFPMMITLTVDQRGKRVEICLKNLKKSYNALMDVLRHTYGKVDYFWILEPHKTGYPHMHLIYWRILSEAEQEHIRNLWSQKYKAGGKRNGVYYSLPKASKDGAFKVGSITKIRSYVLKYLAKSLYKEWLPGEHLFNAVLWKEKARMWGCSRNFSKIMKPATKEKEDWECLMVWKCDNSEYDESERVFFNTIWSRPESCKSHVDCGHESKKGVHSDRDYWEKKKLRDAWLLDKVFQQDKAEALGMFVPFWKRPKIESIVDSRRKLKRLIEGG